MPLIRYTQYITYPDGNPASDVPVALWLLGGNVPVPVFSDKAGTVPVTNPVMTDVDGMVSVYAAPGPLTAELAGQLFPFLVDATETDAAWPGTFVHEQQTPATVWTVAHHFGIEPDVTILQAGARVEATVDHVDSATVTLTFSSPQAGTAFLRR